MGNDTTCNPDPPGAPDLNLEYSPLEALLACIMDAHSLDLSRSRKTRLRDALRALTDVTSERVDEPDSAIARGLHRMAELAYEDYVAQLLPEAGGPDLREGEELPQERSVNQLARQACDDLGLLREANEEILRKKYTATYGKFRSAGERQAYFAAQGAARLLDFDAAREARVLADFRQVAEILARQGIGLRLDQVFWRRLAREQRPYPRTRGRIAAAPEVNPRDGPPARRPFSGSPS